MEINSVKDCKNRQYEPMNPMILQLQHYELGPVARWARTKEHTVQIGHDQIQKDNSVWNCSGN